MTDDERRKLVSTEQSLGMAPEPKMPEALTGLEVFGDEEKEIAGDFSDAESFFNLPAGGHDDEDDEEDDKGRRR
jgi:uncharacterized protein